MGPEGQCKSYCNKWVPFYLVICAASEYSLVLQRVQAGRRCNTCLAFSKMKGVCYIRNVYIM